MADFPKGTIVCKICAMKEECLKLNGLPPCALVAQNSTSTNTTKAEIAKILTGIDRRNESPAWDGIGIVSWIRSQLSALC